MSSLHHKERTMPSSSNTTKNTSQVPPGFRFHPTDEELVNYYLRKKVNMEKFDLDVIRDVDLNKLEPWDLHERCKIDSSQQVEWYFFSHKDKKYPTGSRTNRATMAGFWKATGRDKAVYHCSERIGMRKTLVFYRGRAPHGQKTDWIMHEYRLEEPSESISNSPRNNEDGWVVCRVFKKRIHNCNTNNIKSNKDFTNFYDDQSSLMDNANQEFYDKGAGDGVTQEHQTRKGFSCKEEVNMYSNDEEESDHHVDNVPSLHSPHNQMQKEVECPAINMSNKNNSSSLSSQNNQQNYDRAYTGLMNQSYHETSDMISPNQACCSPNVSFNMQEPTLITTSSTCSSTMASTSTCSSSTNNNLFFPYENDNLMNNLYFEDYISTQDQWAHIGLEVGLPKDLRLYHHVDNTSDLGLISINTTFCTPEFPP